MMTQKTPTTALLPAPSFAQKVMDFLGLAFVFTGLILQFTQRDQYSTGLFVICIGVVLYSIPRMLHKSSIHFDKHDKGEWKSASLKDYQELIEQFKVIEATHPMIPLNASLILLTVASFVILGLGYDKVPEFEVAFFAIIDALVLQYIYSHYKLPAPRPETIHQKFNALECIAAFEYPEDFKLKIEFHLQKLRNSENSAPCDIRFSIDYRHKSPQWYALNLVILPQPQPFFCYAVFIATKPSPVFFAFETIMFPAHWKSEAKLEESYPSLAITYHQGTTVKEIKLLVETLIKGIGSDSFQAVLKSDVKSVGEAFKIIENQEDDEN